MNRPTLKRDLTDQKASSSDVEKLMGVVKTLQNTPLPELSAETRRTIERIPGSKSKVPLIFFGSMGSAFAVFLVLVIVAQTALPGSPLYGIKRGTEYIRALIQPSYKEDIVETRKEELKILEQEAAPQMLIDEAASEYEKASGETNTRQSGNETDTTREQRNSNDSRRGERNESSWSDRWRQRNSDDRSSRENESSRESNWSWR